MPKKFCCIKKCPTNNPKDNCQVFDFPLEKDRDRRKKWLKFAKLPSVSSAKSKGICIRHFSGKFVTRKVDFRSHQHEVKASWISQ